MWMVLDNAFSKHILAQLIGVVATATLLSSVAYGNARKQTRGHQTHMVKSGQSLWQIARDHGCTLHQLKTANPNLNGNHIIPGQQLLVPRCSPNGKVPTARVDLIHTVRPHDTLGQIAANYGSSVRDIKARNGLTSNIIYPGQHLRVIPGEGRRGQIIRGQSIGTAHNGKLKRGVQMRTHRDYHLRRPHRAWGASHVIRNLRQAIRITRSKHKIHRLSIGDISSRNGGKLARHVSHQSGRDVDLGLIFRKKPPGYPRNFVKGNVRNLHLPAMWTLLRTLYSTVKTTNGVELIFLDYKVQEVLYKWARKRRVSEKTLRSMFQYPRGRNSRVGIIRHEPGHKNHLHIRYQCPPRDSKCK